jgi:hypothetical protein
MAAAAAVLGSADLAPLVARHLHDVVDVVERDPRAARMPALLAVSRAVRAACAPAYADGYLTVRGWCLAYTLVPHAAPPRPGAPRELPLAWRVTLASHEFPEGAVVAHVHPVGELWRAARALEGHDPRLPRAMAADAPAALRYVHDGTEGPYDLRLLLALLGVVVDDTLAHVFDANVRPLVRTQAALDAAAAEWRAATRRAGARALGVAA